MTSPTISLTNSLTISPFLMVTNKQLYRNNIHRINDQKLKDKFPLNQTWDMDVVHSIRSPLEVQHIKQI